MNPNRVVPPEGKIPYYRSDGTGRDTYIRDHNGGLLSQDRIHRLKQPKIPHERKFTFSKGQYGRHPYTYQTGGSNKFPHYISDGSGRDFYIKDTQGGNSKPFSWRNQTLFRFKNTLHSHQRFKDINPEKEDIYLKSQTRLTNTASKFNKSLSFYQQGVNTRLSEPKKYLKAPLINTYYQENFDKTRIEKMCDGYLPETKKSFYND